MTFFTLLHYDLCYFSLNFLFINIKVKTPVWSQALSTINCHQITGGSKTIFAVSSNGKAYACGESTNGRLGLGAITGNIAVPRQIDGLSSVFVKKIAVHSGGRHAMALTTDGRVYSWGEGEDGQLGHNNRLYVVIYAFLGTQNKYLMCLLLLEVKS